VCGSRTLPLTLRRTLSSSLNIDLLLALAPIRVLRLQARIYVCILGNSVLVLSRRTLRRRSLCCAVARSALYMDA
jgi:hypothetical protein